MHPHGDPILALVMIALFIWTAVILTHNALGD